MSALKHLPILAAFGLAFSAQAEMAPEPILDKAYGKPNKASGCWMATDKDGQRYCMKIDHAEPRDTVSGRRLYLIVTGHALNEKGEPEDSHASSGLVGAFVAEEQQGQTVLLASNAKIPLGSYGEAPKDWGLRLLGPSDYWGWVNTSGDGNQGVFASWHKILAPYGKSIRELGNIPASFDNEGACGDKRCERSTTSLESTLDIDANQTSQRVFPLRVTVTGNLKGKPLAPKTWTLPFDSQRWSYVLPADWPFKFVSF